METRPLAVFFLSALPLKLFTVFGNCFGEVTFGREYCHEVLVVRQRKKIGDCVCCCSDSLLCGGKHCHQWNICWILRSNNITVAPTNTTSIQASKNPTPLPTRDIVGRLHILITNIVFWTQDKIRSNCENFRAEMWSWDWWRGWVVLSPFFKQHGARFSKYLESSFGFDERNTFDVGTIWLDRSEIDLPSFLWNNRNAVETKFHSNMDFSFSPRERHNSRFHHSFQTKYFTNRRQSSTNSLLEIVILFA